MHAKCKSRQEEAREGQTIDDDDGKDHGGDEGRGGGDAGGADDLDAGHDVGEDAGLDAVDDVGARGRGAEALARGHERAALDLVLERGGAEVRADARGRAEAQRGDAGAQQAVEDVVRADVRERRREQDRARARVALREHAQQVHDRVRLARARRAAHEAQPPVRHRADHRALALVQRGPLRVARVERRHRTRPPLAHGRIHALGRRQRRQLAQRPLHPRPRARPGARARARARLAQEEGQQADAGARLPRAALEHDVLVLRRDRRAHARQRVHRVQRPRHRHLVVSSVQSLGGWGEGGITHTSGHTSGHRQKSKRERTSRKGENKPKHH